MDVIAFYEIGALISFALPVLFLIVCVIVCCLLRSLKPIPFFLLGVFWLWFFLLRAITFLIAYDDIAEPAYYYFQDWNIQKACFDLLPSVFITFVLGVCWGGLLPEKLNCPDG